MGTVNWIQTSLVVYQGKWKRSLLACRWLVTVVRWNLPNSWLEEYAGCLGLGTAAYWWSCARSEWDDEKRLTLATDWEDNRGQILVCNGDRWPIKDWAGCKTLLKMTVFPCWGDLFTAPFPFHVPLFLPLFGMFIFTSLVTLGEGTLQGTAQLAGNFCPYSLNIYRRSATCFLENVGSSSALIRQLICTRWHFGYRQ